jgi:uncharacterized protein YgiM (DUF1202 family)
MKFSSILIFLIFIITIYCTPTIAKEFVVVIHKGGVNIRTQPDLNSIIICKASKGQLFNYSGETEKFYKIELFTDKSRYISKSLTTRLSEIQLLPGHNFKLPSEQSIISNILSQIKNAKNRSLIESEEIIPIKISQKYNSNYKSILEDRYLCELFQSFRIQPAIYNDLKKERITK